jgi:pimeloyl-ACP methyl ester carboxylesterase
MTMQTVHEIHRPDATIRYWVSGSPASSRRPTVVLLHGATLDHRAWDRQVDALRDRFRLVVPDLRAHGESTGGFDFAAAVDDVRALLEALPTEDLILVGLSLGANIAQELVRQDHGRIRALVLADATCNTAARHPLSALLSVAALHGQALITGPGFAQRAARTIARDSRAQGVRFGGQRPAEQRRDRRHPVLAAPQRPAIRPDLPAAGAHTAGPRRI